MKLLASVIVLAGLVGGCNSTPTAPTVNVPFSIVDLRVGTGPTATTVPPATVNYSGWLYNSGGIDNKGTRFDAGTFSVTPSRSAIPGFMQGIVGMQVGGIRRVTIPPNLGYGAQGNGATIPPNSTLIFEIELVSIP